MTTSPVAAIHSLDDYRDHLAGIPADKFLGSILWFTVSGGTVTKEELTEWFDELGLDPAYLPNDIKKLDAFRRATSDAKVEYAISAHEVAELTIQEVDSDRDKIVRHIVKKTRNRSAKKLVFDSHLGEAVFYKEGRGAKSQGLAQSHVRWAVNPSLNDLDREMANQLVKDANDRYANLSTYLTGQALRAVLRNYICDLNAISVRPSGGVYFVHKSKQATVDQLVKLVSRLGSGSLLHTLPLIDSDSQRTMLVDQFEEQIVNDIEALVREVLEASQTAKAKDGSVSLDKFRAYQARFNELTERARETTQNLDIAQDRSASAFEVALNALTGLAARI